MNYEKLMLRAISHANQYKYTAKPNPVVGCIIVKGKEIISEGAHEKFGCNHAEINAIRLACTVREDLYLSDCTMYVTLEPCSMCLGAIINSRLKKLVYGLPSPKYGAFSSNHSTFKDTEGLIKNTEVYGGFYQSEISLIMREFFEDKRTRFDGNRH